MRRLVVLSFVTLDGVMQAPGRPRGGYERQFQPWRMGSRLLGQVHGRSHERADGKTIRSTAWPEDLRDIRGLLAKAKDDPFANKLNKARKYVVSTTLRKLEWNNSTLVTGNIPEEI